MNTCMLCNPHNWHRVIDTVHMQITQRCHQRCEWTGDASSCLHLRNRMHVWGTQMQNIWVRDIAQGVTANRSIPSAKRIKRLARFCRNYHQIAKLKLNVKLLKRLLFTLCDGNQVFSLDVHKATNEDSNWCEQQCVVFSKASTNPYMLHTRKNDIPHEAFESSIDTWMRLHASCCQTTSRNHRPLLSWCGLWKCPLLNELQYSTHKLPKHASHSIPSVCKGA